MNKFFMVLFLFSFLNLLSQEKHLKVYLYKSSNDYKNGIKELAGRYLDYSWSSTGSFVLKLKNEEGQKLKKRIDKDYWGFELDNYCFRIFKLRRPLLVLREKEKVFYMDGISKLLDFSKTPISINYRISIKPSFKNMFLYSYNLTGKTHKVYKAVKKNNEHILPNNLIKCLKVAYRHQISQSSGYEEIVGCINSF
ncbi:hypothetical protein [Hyunsoonleella ulvae]|uniref:hypothetical protein n=1 Tax=Hyunsoonleella ulvae TaxID=2799948 RepID=UPI0019392A4B|nr:hypothetical protein [Hyunsoonleella ulvae]